MERERINNTFIEPVLEAPMKIELEVGDLTKPDFYPQVKMKHWDNECNFSIRLKDDAPTEGVVKEEAGKIEWERDGRKARFYPKDTGDQYGGYEFEVELSSRPVSNVIEYTIQSKGLEFNYQPALSDVIVPKDGETVTETEYRRANGDLIESRPENVVGSYAVYHKDNPQNKLGGKVYKSGKAFHLYRPWAEDAKGTRVWCELNVDPVAETASITIPQEFLDSAVYPVLVDPTAGYTSIGASDLSMCSASYDGLAGINLGLLPALSVVDMNAALRYPVAGVADSYAFRIAYQGGQGPATNWLTAWRPTTFPGGASFRFIASDTYTWHVYTMGGTTSFTPEFIRLPAGSYTLAVYVAEDTGSGSSSLAYDATGGDSIFGATDSTAVSFLTHRLSLYMTYTDRTEQAMEPHNMANSNFRSPRPSIFSPGNAR